MDCCLLERERFIEFTLNIMWLYRDSENSTNVPNKLSEQLYDVNQMRDQTSVDVIIRAYFVPVFTLTGRNDGCYDYVSESYHQPVIACRRAQIRFLFIMKIRLGEKNIKC